MRKLLFFILGSIIRGFLSLRYRIHLKGFEKLSSLDKSKGVIFLPNHPAHIDPIMVFCLLGKRFLPRPIVVEYIYRKPFVQFFMRLVRAIPIPNFETALNEIKIQKAEKILEKMVEGLQKGEKFVLYPSGRLKYTGKEVLGATSLAHSLIQKCPDVQIVMIRTSGLWGSSFSKAYLGHSPDFVDNLVWSLKKLLKNAIFFMPRRKIHLEMVVAKEDFPRTGSRLEVNRFLENFYNQYPTKEGIVDVEPLERVSYAFWKEDLLEPFVREKKKRNKGEDAFASLVGQEIYHELKRKFPDVDISLDSELASDLGMDSLDMAEMITFLSVHYDVGELHASDIETVQDLIDIAEGRKSGERKSRDEKRYQWPEERERKEPILPMGKTMVESFLLMADRMQNSYACGDDLSGVLSYKKLKMVAIVLSRSIKKLPGEKIGILLPASLGAYLAILATYFAGKVPVMLNWTLGPKYLKDMTELSQVESILSSWQFLEKLGNVSFGDVSQKFILLEDVKKNICFSDKLCGFFSSLVPTKTLLSLLRLDKIKEEDTAVILFTSGTESTPKGVPLSHKNILSNQRAVLELIDVYASDLFYGVLPPFHSFGFAVTGLLPILAGVRVVFYPDPTDSFSLVEGISRWKITIFCSAPSFLRALLQAASPEDLSSIRLLVAGAEKTPQDLFDAVARLRKELIEGYGITECSPILTINIPGQPPHGVGKVLPGIETCTIHPETLKVLPQGQEGEICVRGLNVFSGYLGHPRSPFIELEGKQWYRTGDFGRVEDGFIVLSGRLKRFTKIAGEMISLGAIEEDLYKRLSSQITDEMGPCIVVMANEKEKEKTSLVLFTTLAIERAEVNQMLKEAGFSPLVRISLIQRLEKIPLLGTGKIDYRNLQNLV